MALPLHTSTTPECEERFKAIDGQIDALRRLAQGTEATVQGVGTTPGVVTSLALVVQRLGAVEDRLGELVAAPREVRDEMVAGFGRVEGILETMAKDARPQQSTTTTTTTTETKAANLEPWLVRALLAALAIIATLLGLDAGGLL